jgi:hypothetical protein
MARRSPPRKVTYFEPVLAAPRAQHDVRGRPPLPLHVLQTHDYEMAGRFLQAANTTASQYQGQVLAI